MLVEVGAERALGRADGLDLRGAEAEREDGPAVDPERRPGRLDDVAVRCVGSVG